MSGVTQEQVRSMLLIALDVLRNALNGNKATMPLPRPATVQERMMMMLGHDPGRIEWSARQWAQALACTPGAVHATPAWRRIMTARALEKARRLEAG